MKNAGDVPSDVTSDSADATVNAGAVEPEEVRDGILQAKQTSSGPGNKKKRKKHILFHKDLLDFQPDDLELEHRPTSGRIRWTLYVILLLITAAVTWASIAEVDRVVSASGKLITTAPRILIEPLETSVIRKIYVRMGAIVKKGQPLVTLDPTFTSADVSQVREQLESLYDQQARLQAELEGKEYRPEENRDTKGSKLQSIIHLRRILEYKSKESAFHERTEATKASLLTNKEQLSSLRRQLEVLKEIEDMRAELRKKKTGSRLDLLNARKDRIDVSTEVARLNKKSVELGHELKSVAAERQAFIASWRKETAEKMVDSLREIERLEQLLKKAERRQSMVELSAPSDAVVLEVADISIGSVVREAEPLVTLVPIDVPLEAEVDVQTRDIGRIRIGDSARVKLEAFPFQRHGTIDGKVKTISEDVFQKSGPGGTSVYSTYRARISLADTKLKDVPEGYRLIPGMHVTVEVKVGKRRVINYFLYPLIRALDESIRES